jgi:hypothetical protein
MTGSGVFRPPYVMGAKGNPPQPSKERSDMDKVTLLGRLNNEDGQVWSYVLKKVLVAVLIGAIITQCGPIIWNHISVHGAADDVAEEAAIAYQNSKGNMDEVYKIVEEALSDRDVRLDGTIGVVMGPDGKPQSVTVPVRKVVNTFLFENVGYLCRYTEAKAFAEHPLP